MDSTSTPPPSSPFKEKKKNCLETSEARHSESYFGLNAEEPNDFLGTFPWSSSTAELCIGKTQVIAESNYLKASS